MKHNTSNQAEITAVAQTRSQSFVQWLQDPLGSIIASSVAVIGSFGLVISGSWFIHLALN